MFLIPKGDLHLPTNMKVEPWQDLKGALTIGVSTYTGKDRCSAHNRTIDIRPSEMRFKDVVKRIDMLQTSPKKDLITKNIKMKQTNKKNTHSTNLTGTQSIQWRPYAVPLFVYMNAKNVHLMHRCTLKKALHSERQT